MLQICANEESFKQATNLFLQKWRNTEPLVTGFLDYFQEQWLRKLSYWYEGASLGFPSTNNGVEGTNAVIKRDHTIRERLPVGQFLHNVVDLVRKWSERRDPVNIELHCIRG